MARANKILRLTHTDQDIQDVEIILPPSKSIISRQLVLRAVQGLPLLDRTMRIDSWSDDNKAILDSLLRSAQGDVSINAGESGTAMRLLTAYLAATVKKETILRGEGRQHERIIAPLVDTLRSMGADIDYCEKEGFPPLIIRPAVLHGGKVSLDASVSSQFISALLLIAPLLNEDLDIELSNIRRVSEPYAHMTAAMMAQNGCVVAEKSGGYYIRSEQGAVCNSLGLEADWTAASYFYAIAAVSPQPIKVHIPALYLSSLQGDCEYVQKLFEAFNVITQKTDSGVIISQGHEPCTDKLIVRMNHCPDLVPTIVSVCLFKKIAFHIKGVEALRAKESDRLAALYTEFAKLGYELEIKDDEIMWQSSSSDRGIRNDEIIIDSHNDHRIAMALALWAFGDKGVSIQSPDVVKKSFPGFWNEIQKQGVRIEER